MPSSGPTRERAVMALTVGTLLMAACTGGTSTRRTFDSAPGAALMARNAVTADAEAYAAALVALIAKRSPLWDSTGTDTIRVLDTVYWWPIVQPSGSRGAALGPVPFAMAVVARRYQLAVATIPAADGDSTSGLGSTRSPLMVLGPIAFTGPDAAVLRICIYLGPNGQELYRIALERGLAGWSVVTAEIELQS